MQAKTFGTWASFFTSVGAGALTQSPDYQFLALPVALISGALFLILAGMFLFSNRREIRRTAKLIEPLHIIILGLVIALCGVLWLMRFPDPRLALLQSRLTTVDSELAAIKTERDARPTASDNQTIKNRVSQLEADNKAITAERERAIKERDEARQQSALRPAIKPEVPTPVAPKREYSPEEKIKLKGLMITISEIINTDGSEIYQKAGPYSNVVVPWRSTNTQESFDLASELRDKTKSLVERLFTKIIAQNRYFERDLTYIVGSNDQKNPPFVLLGQLGDFAGRFRLVLDMLPRMKDDPNGGTEQRLIGMAGPQVDALGVATARFREWIIQCNERIDEKTRELQ